MSDCIINSGLPRGCRDNAGGLYTFYVANYPSGTTVSSEFLTKDVEGIVTDFTGSTVSTPIEFYEFTPNKNSGAFTEEYAVSLENGTHGYTQKVEAMFAKMDQAKQTLVDNLASGNFLLVAKDKNGKLFLAGENDAVVLAAGSAGSGKVLGDLNGYTLTLQAEEGKPAPEVNPDAITLA